LVEAALKLFQIPVMADEGESEGPYQRARQTSLTHQASTIALFIEDTSNISKA